MDSTISNIFRKMNVDYVKFSEKGNVTAGKRMLIELEKITYHCNSLSIDIRKGIKDIEEKRNVEKKTRKPRKKKDVTITPIKEELQLPDLENEADDEKEDMEKERERFEKTNDILFKIIQYRNDDLCTKDDEGCITCSA